MQPVEQELEFEAEYQLESAVKCTQCAQDYETVKVVRLLRKKVNFTSSLPRRGYLVVCPNCHAAVPAVIGSRGIA